MPQSDYAVTVTVSRPTYSSSPSPTKPRTGQTTIQSGVTATKHFYGRASQRQIEGTQQGGGPGGVLRTEVFFKFTQSAPPVQPGDEITESGGGTYTVKHVRAYERTLQADCEIFG